MKIKVTNLLLLGGAFVVAGLASGRAITQYDGGEVTALLILASLILFVICASFMFSLGTVRKQRTEWDRLIKFLDGEYGVWSTSVRGTLQDMPVFARIESANNNDEYLDASCACYCNAKYFFALTVTFPYKEHDSWQVFYKLDSQTYDHGRWTVVCEESQAISKGLENAGAADLFSEWDKFTGLKCNADTGELTLRYPAPFQFFCPSLEEIQSHVTLLKRVGDMWQHVVHPRIAA